MAKLKGSDSRGDFGRAVALEGDRVLVGAPYEQGAAYLFEPDGDGRWNEVAKLVALNREFSDNFGGSVDLSGDTVVIGDDLDDEVGYLAGAAHVFERDPSGAWLEVRKLITSDAAPGDSFGLEVAVSGDTVLVGADPPVVPGPTGAVYVFHRNAGGPDRWGEVDRLVPPDGREHDHFGTALAASGALLLVGARNHLVEPGSVGAAYVYARKPLRWADQVEDPEH